MPQAENTGSGGTELFHVFYANMFESVNKQKVFGSFARYVLTFCRNSATIRVAEGISLLLKINISYAM